MKPERPKKVFLSDWDLRRLKASGGRAGIPDNAIISPLAAEWLAEPLGGEAERQRGGWTARQPGSQKTCSSGGPAAQPSSCPACSSGRLAAQPPSCQAELSLRIKIAEIGRRLYALGFVPATDGNISARLDARTILITPSGVSKGGLAPEDMAKIDMEGRLISGKKPSSEYLLHLCFYGRRADVSAVVHAHPPLATGLASAGVALDKPLTSEIVISLGAVPLARYATPGTGEVTASIEELVGGHNAIMLANHGVVTCGRDLETAFQRMETVEQAAKITLAAEQAGGGKLIPREKLAELDAIRGRLGL